MPESMAKDRAAPPNTGFEVMASGGVIFVGRVQAEASSRKIMAPEWMNQVGLKPGGRFGG
jgi:hypothetical protein